MHTEDALKLGESPRRIFALSVWHESHLFSDEERVVLQLTEEVTKIGEKGLTEETYKNAIQTFGEQRTAQIIMLIVTINAWNRIAVSTRLIYKE
jgi:alkylhydroperoxidase family enzyme